MTTAQESAQLMGSLRWRHSSGRNRLVPVWLIIILLSPFDAYTATKAVTRQP
jgi:hypothetical protein